MVEYSEDQREIAETLLEGPMSIEELREELDMDAQQLNKELKEMINLDVVEMKGDKYKLIDYIEQQLGKGEKLEGKYKIRMVIEGSSNHPQAVEKEMKKLEESMKKDPFKILEFERAETEVEEDPETGRKSASSFIEVEYSVPKFSDLVYLVTNYGPSSVEVLEPGSVELNMEEMQKSLNNLASAVHYYTGLIIQLKQQINQRKNI